MSHTVALVSFGVGSISMIGLSEFYTQNDNVKHCEDCIKIKSTLQPGM